MTLQEREIAKLEKWVANFDYLVQEGVCFKVQDLNHIRHLAESVKQLTHDAFNTERP